MSLAASLEPRSRRRASGLNLKWVLVRRILLVAVLCMLGGAILVLRDISQQAASQNEEASATVAKQLSLQLTRIDAALDLPNRFPDWAAVVNYALHPGQCLQYSEGRETSHYSNCQGTDVHDQIAPDWFVDAYARFPGASTIERPLLHKGVQKGTILATIEPRAIADRAWRELSRLLGIAATMIAAMCILVYVVVERALKPTADILSGLNHLADGDLTHRLPRFKMQELDRIAEVFNGMAHRLETATGERTELARKLVNAQEQERQHIARELHDDVAQRLSALNGLATSIKRACQALAPPVAKKSEELVELASGTMRSLRDTLTHLRPPEIDDLGLLTSIQNLVEGQNRRAEGNTRFTLETSGPLDGLPAETAAHIYRIVQEGLSNAARHAHAHNVQVVISSSGQLQSDKRRIELSVVDDGKGAGPANDPKPGIGLSGIRERVYALSGSFSAQERDGQGFELRVSFPIQRIGQEAA